MATMEIRQTDEFHSWMTRLRDSRAKQKIAVRVRRLAFENPGDVKPVGRGVSELRIPYRPGYRVYFAQGGPVLIVLLSGGDRSSQATDIERAHRLLENLEP